MLHVTQGKSWMPAKIKRIMWKQDLNAYSLYSRARFSKGVNRKTALRINLAPKLGGELHASKHGKAEAKALFNNAIAANDKRTDYVQIQNAEWGPSNSISFSFISISLAKPRNSIVAVAGKTECWACSLNT